jgi:hypothetical protein
MKQAGSLTGHCTQLVSVQVLALVINRSLIKLIFNQRLPHRIPHLWQTSTNTREEERTKQKRLLMRGACVSWARLNPQISPPADENFCCSQSQQTPGSRAFSKRWRLVISDSPPGTQGAEDAATLGWGD